MIILFTIVNIIFFSCKEQVPKDNFQVDQETVVVDSVLNKKENKSKAIEVVEMDTKEMSVSQDKTDVEDVSIEMEEFSSDAKTEEKEKVKSKNIEETDGESWATPVKEVKEEQVNAEEKVKNEVNQKIAVDDNSEIEGVKPNHQVFSDLLKRHVDEDGNVDYIGIRLDIEEFDAYLKDLSNNFIEDSWSKNEKLAYWINAYNAFTIKLILNNYPVSSITKIDGGKAWDTKWIELGDNKYSLDQIENDIIRPQFNDPRIHFAINCAAKSCPPLANKAFTESNLNDLLESRTKVFITNAKFNEITSNNVKISRIFNWYREDFGDLIEFLNKYSINKISASAKINFQEYDWDLNSI